MSEDKSYLDSHWQTPEDDMDPGEPIQELLELDVQLSPNFVEKLLRAIDRRTLSNELIDCGWLSIVEIFKEYWVLILSIVTSRNKD